MNLQVMKSSGGDGAAAAADAGGCGTGGSCGTSCGAGLEKVYPTTAVRFGAMNWIGEFSYKPGTVFKCGAKIVISTSRGIELGEQVSLTCNGCSKSVTRDQIRQYVENSGPEFYEFRAGRILREATAVDMAEQTRLCMRKMEDKEHCRLLAAQLDLDMHIVTVERLLGGERMVFYFRAEQRVDFRELVRRLALHHHLRIEMRQVGARDEARLVADYEVCGRECCCKNFLKKLRPVNMKMAKLQKATLDPSKVSGRCGRLRCCLRYEHEGYEQLDRKLPRSGSWVETADGVAQVIDRQILTQLLLVRTVQGQELTFPLEELKAVDVAAPPVLGGSDAGDPRAQRGPRESSSFRGRRGGSEPRGSAPAGERPDGSPSGGSAPDAGREPPDRRRARGRRGDDGGRGGGSDQPPDPAPPME